MSLVVECPACWNKRKHRVGCPVLLLEYEAVRKALAQVASHMERVEGKLNPETKEIPIDRTTSPS